MPRSSWMLPSSDEEDEGEIPDDIPLLPAGSLHFSRHRWMRKVMALIEEYCICFIMPAMCMFAVYALIMDRYASEMLILSTNSSVLLQPSPFLVDAVEVQVVGENQGPELYGFDASPDLGSFASWSESHNMLVAPDQIEGVALWLNKGSVLNVTCQIRQPEFQNIVLKTLQERRSTREWFQDFRQKSELDCNQDGTTQYRVPKDGNYSFALENLGLQTAEVFLSFDVVATLYNTNTAVYLCVPFPQACQLQVSFFGNKVAVLSTPNYFESNTWKIDVAYKVRWLQLASALGCVFFVASTFLKLVSQFHLRNSQNGEEDEAEGNEEGDWADYEEISEDGDFGDNFHCVICVDANKDSFFLPCGHCATCLSCGQKLKIEGGVCPSCKIPIEMVNQMFHV